MPEPSRLAKTELRRRRTHALLAAAGAPRSAYPTSTDAVATLPPLGCLEFKIRKLFQALSGIPPVRLAPGHSGFLWLQLNLKLGEVSKQLLTVP